MKALWQVEYREAHHVINKLHTTMKLCQNDTDTHSYYWLSIQNSVIITSIENIPYLLEQTRSPMAYHMSNAISVLWQTCQNSSISGEFSFCPKILL